MTVDLRPAYESNRIISRSEIGLGAVVLKFNRITRRPRLARSLGLIVMHYTGVGRSYAGLSFSDVCKVIRAIGRWKSGEYNYVIDQAGRVYEFAGEYEGAHARGYNDRGYGVLFLNGTGDPCTDEQVLAYRWLRGCLQWVGAVNPTPFQVPHKWIGATACPGPVADRYEALAA